MALLLPLGTSCQSKGTPGSGGGGEPLGQRASALTAAELTIDGVGYQDTATGAVVALPQGQVTDLVLLGADPAAGGYLLINSAKPTVGNTTLTWKVVTNGTSATVTASNPQVHSNGSSDVQLAINVGQIDERNASLSYDAECVLCTTIITDPASVDVIDVEAWDPNNGKIASWTFMTTDQRPPGYSTAATGNGVCDIAHSDQCEIYGSGYSSNCYCLSCTLYCAVNGKTEKAGTCCT
jgi:hypothetical protein